MELKEKRTILPRPTTSNTTVALPGQPYDVYIGRHILPGYDAVRNWGNPFVWRRELAKLPGAILVGSKAEALYRYKLRVLLLLESCPVRRDEALRMKGKRLGGCGCGGGHCAHGPVLAAVVDSIPGSARSDYRYHPE